ncbi:MAG: phage scaffolding protein [Anaerolineales bacterium]
MSDETKPLAGDNQTNPQAGNNETQAVNSDAQAVSETISLEEARKLRSEAANLRKRLKELEDQKRQMDEAKLSETERLQKRLAELERAQADWERERQEIMLQRHIENAAAKLGIVDPEAAWKLIDLKEVDFDDDGKPKNVETLLKALIQKKPYLANNPQFARSAGAGNGAGGKAHYSMNDFIRRSSGRK